MHHMIKGTSATRKAWLSLHRLGLEKRKTGRGTLIHIRVSLFDA